MGRNRSFDEDSVVDAAAAAFRDTGYEATSIDDLVRVTGLHRGSLYSAFGSKRGLFLLALRRHIDTPAPATEDELDLLLDLLLVALLELAPRDADVRSVAESALARLSQGDPAALLGGRIIERAHLTSKEQP